MKTLMKEDSSDADSNSFLLDDNSGIPFSVDDISRSLQHTDFTRVKPPAELLETPGFEFYKDNAVFLQHFPLIFEMPTSALGSGNR
ncbi:UNVERIFIED_CONTAM: Myosin-6 [Sesamum calycinum]|uniref:Myosin-6 n=1 Tax=Sesamum calycinum TaxID=2727403 RepID=A0AAW2QKT5_9LAMI